MNKLCQHYNTTLLPIVNTLIARGMFCGAKYNFLIFFFIFFLMYDIVYTKARQQTRRSRKTSAVLHHLCCFLKTASSRAPRKFFSSKNGAGGWGWGAAGWGGVRWRGDTETSIQFFVIGIYAYIYILSNYAVHFFFFSSLFSSSYENAL